jgi:hypothetical protein
MRTKQSTRSHVITGERGQVRSVLERAHWDGRLVAVTEARVLDHGRVRVIAELRRSPDERSRWDRCRPWLVGAAKVLAVLAALAAVTGVVWLAVLAVLELIALLAALVAWVQAHLVQIGLTVAAVLALLIYLAAGGDRCSGMHCGGCRR